MTKILMGGKLQKMFFLLVKQVFNLNLYLNVRLYVAVNCFRY